MVPWALCTCPLPLTRGTRPYFLIHPCSYPSEQNPPSRGKVDVRFCSRVAGLGRVVWEPFGSPSLPAGLFRADAATPHAELAVHAFFPGPPLPVRPPCFLALLPSFFLSHSPLTSRRLGTSFSSASLPLSPSSSPSPSTLHWLCLQLSRIIFPHHRLHRICLPTRIVFNDLLRPRLSQPSQQIFHLHWTTLNVEECVDNVGISDIWSQTCKQHLAFRAVAGQEFGMFGRLQIYPLYLKAEEGMSSWRQL